MLRLRVRDLGDSTHSEPEHRGHVKARCHPRVVIDCERRRVTAYTQDGTRVVFQGGKHDILPQTVYESSVRDN